MIFSYPKIKLFRPIYSVLGVGYISIGSGTFCSLLPCILILFFGDNINYLARFLILIPILLISFISLNVEFENEDPSFVVIDEFVGMWISLLLFDEIILILISFFLFRFFDITKFLGINKIEKLNGSLGIMLDDIVAGIYTLIIVFFIKIFLFQ
ncbi:MAG: phosphatidylglycerophosphatase A [Chloroflexi bacterium]|nr:phosphatidylglycerophosphatase A [Chloroflexota bacterium]